MDHNFPQSCAKQSNFDREAAYCAINTSEKLNLSISILELFTIDIRAAHDGKIQQITFKIICLADLLKIEQQKGGLRINNLFTTLQNLYSLSLRHLL